MSNNKPRIVLDTNVLLVSISSKSQYHWIFECLLNAEFELFISNDILNEYEEIISNKFNSIVAKNIIRTLLLLSNVYKVEIFYNWNLITDDGDDNKFVDCAISANAHLIITHDRHFNVLEKIEFPKIRTADIETFRRILLDETN